MSEFRFKPEHLTLIRQRVKLGDEDWEIAGRLGCDRSTLFSICSQHGIDLNGDPKRALTAIIGADDKTLRAFAAEAARRGVSAHSLMSSCLCVIASDKLFTAVLED